MLSFQFRSRDSKLMKNRMKKSSVSQSTLANGQRYVNLKPVDLIDGANPLN
jgi:hypothetical protein